MFFTEHTKMEYSQITDQIFIGTNFCCMTHFNEDLLGQGITFDLSLEADRVDTPLGGAGYLWIPIPDRHAPTMQQMRLGVSFIAQAVQTDNKVYIHCKNGHGRAPTMVAAYFITTGMTADEAAAFIKQKRPEVHIEPDQMRALYDFERTSNH